MEALKEMKDNQFDLAIVDPPYGIIDNKKSPGFRNDTFKTIKKAKKWDVLPPTKYWDELFRVSKNQIIWGFQYFMDELKPTKSIIIWNKMNGENFMNDAELAWNNVKGNNKIFNHAYIGRYHPDPIKIHPTQKPTALYEFLLMTYAKKGDKILDTHLGSGSIAIACHNLGFDLEGYELDKEYFKAASKRLKQHQQQTRMF